MVRIKATGEVTEVERTVMQVLRSEEKRFRRAMSLDQEADRDGISKPTILSLDVLPEDVTDSNWLADTVDYTEEISTKLLEQRLRESLTPTQCWRREIATIFCREYLTNFCRKSRSQQNK